MLVYGLTGGIGSGKSAVASLLEEYGIPVVSADELSRMVVAPGSSGLRAVVEAFGDDVIAPDGSLDRRAMAAQIFADAGKRKTLESILHPKIRESFQQVLSALEDAGHELTVYEVPLLFEKGHEKDLHAVILVTASERTRMARVQRRDGLSEDEVLARMRAQMPEDEKRRRADYVIDNEGSLDDLRREVQIMLPRFLKVRRAPFLRLLPSRGEVADEIEEIDAVEVDDVPSAENTLVGGAAEDLELPSEVQTSVGPAPTAEPNPSDLATMVGPSPTPRGAPSTLETSVGPAPDVAAPSAVPAAVTPVAPPRAVPEAPSRGPRRRASAAAPRIPGTPAVPTSGAPTPAVPTPPAAAPPTPPAAPVVPPAPSTSGPLPPPPKTGES